MKFPQVRTSTEKAFLAYHNKPYFETADVRELFDCSSSTAVKIKKLVKEEMDKEGIKIYCERDNYIDRDLLYKLAGLNIDAINKSYKILEKNKQC